MTFPFRQQFLCFLVSIFGLASTTPSKSANAAVPGCPTPALERFQRHKVASGETLASIAQRYNLMPTTIIGMNPDLRNRTVAIGSEILIPPYDGIVVEVPRGQTWREVAAKYKIRADALFEVNGCEKDPRVVFVPQGNSSRSRPVTNSTTASSTTPIKFTGYPLPENARVALAYGWQINPSTSEVFFHSGVDLLASVGTSVEAIAPGTVVFAGNQGTYGNLVIINHAGKLQSRYAHLENIKVSVGQQVKQQDEIGTVGTTGKPTSTQPHLHFEIRSSSDLGWVAKDPNQYMQR
ncbi:peptidase M23B [Tolypothrix sp. NIES-4075]|uniref:LysM peptidoglycan-binding domain-containing M23 family metallopeptidase n=1 Tax=Tolypothrix sp. NIES-4075 TaxID=2005459 RepID=UPI000B5CC9EA|nr:M23 family metallopeptidase [Tolypothrix sp. NIES-4075]GAX39405.1 peptidase M23B [Tolypothrix sp. NIES-4075]